jgi:hypothetical protein
LKNAEVVLKTAALSVPASALSVLRIRINRRPATKIEEQLRLKLVRDLSEKQGALVLA